MAYQPISKSGIQFVDSNGDPYSGAVLKAYESGTSTVLSMATDSTGGTTATSMALNSDGNPEVSGNVVIPHVNENYKLSLYPTQTAADANTGAIWTVDAIKFQETPGIDDTSDATAIYIDSDENVGVGIDPVDLFHVHEATAATNTVVKLTNADIGGTASDGFDIEVTVTGEVQLNNRENASLVAYTNNTVSVTVDNSGTLVMARGAINEFKGADIASATTTNIGAATGNFVDITGTTTITGFGTVQAGTRRTVQFDGALTLTYNASSLILPGNANITTAAGDVAEFYSLGSGNWICTNYQSRASSPVLGDLASVDAVSETEMDWVNSDGMTQMIILHTDDTNITHTGVTKTAYMECLIYIPTNANSLAYNGYGNIAASDETARLIIDFGATAGGNSTTTSTSDAIWTESSVDVSGISGWQLAEINLQSSGVARLITLKAVSARFI